MTARTTDDWVRGPSSLEMPSIDVVRRLTDSHVLMQLMHTEAATRAQIASRTGISKPTISESIRRLVAAGQVVDAGQQASERGRSGTNYRLADDLGNAVAIDAGPQGVIGEVLDLRGTVLLRVERHVSIPCTPDSLGSAIEQVARSIVDSTAAPLLAVSMSIADPVDQRSGQIANLPNSPFLVGEFEPQTVLERVGIARDVVLVDNDTNFGAIAEHRAGAGQGLQDFAYLWLGAGIGLGLVINGSLHRGWSGLAGEIWQTTTRGPGGIAVGLAECFGLLGLLSENSAAIDVDAINAVLASESARDQQVAQDVIDAVSTALANAIALVNPKTVIVAGPWSQAGRIRQQIEQRVTQASIGAEVVAAGVADNPFLLGTRLDSIERARSIVLAS